MPTLERSLQAAQIPTAGSQPRAPFPLSGGVFCGIQQPAVERLCTRRETTARARRFDGVNNLLAMAQRPIIASRPETLNDAFVLRSLGSPTLTPPTMQLSEGRDRIILSSVLTISFCESSAWRARLAFSPRLAEGSSRTRSQCIRDLVL
jgi:hypothetical protein